MGQVRVFTLKDQRKKEEIKKLLRQGKLGEARMLVEEIIPKEITERDRVEAKDKILNSIKRELIVEARIKRERGQRVAKLRKGTGVAKEEKESGKKAKTKQKAEKAPPLAQIPKITKIKIIRYGRTKDVIADAKKMYAGEYEIGLNYKTKGRWIGGARGVWNHRDIAVVQEFYNLLIENGILEGKKIRVDGIYGKNTAAAIKKIQQLVGAKVDGYFGMETMKKVKEWSKAKGKVNKPKTQEKEKKKKTAKKQEKTPKKKEKKKEEKPKKEKEKSLKDTPPPGI